MERSQILINDASGKDKQLKKASVKHFKELVTNVKRMAAGIVRDAGGVKRRKLEEKEEKERVKPAL